MIDLLKRVVTAAVVVTTCACSSRSDVRVPGDNVPVLSSDERISALAPMSVRLVGSFGSEIDSTGRYMFGRITDLEADTAGRIYVLDTGFREIKVFRDREFVRRIRLPDGRGPGEFVNPISISVAADGARILVVDRSPPRVTAIGPSGEYYSSFVAHRPYFDIVQLRGGNLLQVQMPMALRSDEPMVRTLSASGAEIGNSFGYRQRRYQQLFDEGIRSGLPEVRVDVLDELLFIAYGYPYELQVWSTVGELRSRFSRSVPGFDQTMERGLFMLKRGQVSCVAARHDSLVVVFAHDKVTEDTRISMYDFAGARRGDTLASEIGLKLQPILQCSFDRDGRLWVTSISDYPSLSALLITPDHDLLLR